jgi:hypothetical protein
LRGAPEFNGSRSTELYREDEIDYMIGMVRTNSKEFKELNFLQPLYNKALRTLELIMGEQELSIPDFFTKL